MQITNQDHDIIIDYQNNGDNVRRVATYPDGHLGMKLLDKDEADADAIDLLDNFDYSFI